MKNMMKTLAAVGAVLEMFAGNESEAMAQKISQHFEQILKYRKDLVDTIKPFMNNCEMNVKKEQEPQDPVREAIKGDDLEALEKLIEEKGISQTITASFNEVKKVQIPLMQYAVMKGATKCFKYLLINGIDDPTRIMEDDEYPWDCMAMAIYFGNNEVVKILEEKGFEKGRNSTYLEVAILSYRNDMAKDIIEGGVSKDILIKGLLAAAKNNNIKGAELLISHGANVNATDSKGRTLLHRTVDYNSREVGELLISHGADVNAKNGWDQTPLHCASYDNNKEAADLLISKGADVNARDQWDDTPLCKAMETNSKEMVELLIKHGADINAKGQWGETLLHQAVDYNNSREIFELIISKGADVNAKDQWGYTPLHLAACDNSKEMVDLLIGYGADVNAKGEDGKTPRDIRPELFK